MKKTSLLLLLFYVFTSNAQISDSIVYHNTKNLLNKYYTLDRETVAVISCKKTYFNEETIWIKGFVYNLKTKKPYWETTNVFAKLYTENGEVLQEKLFFCSLGQFEGSFYIDKKIPSGYYYLQVYTNWMNNFQENLAPIKKIEIINTSFSVFTKEKPNSNTSELLFFPEGGNFIQNIPNTLAIKLQDCNKNILPFKNFTLFNANNEEIFNGSVNDFGIGKLSLNESQQNGYLIFNDDPNKTKFHLPVAQKEGLNIEVNPVSNPNMIFLKIRFSNQTVEKFDKKKVYLIIHQENNVFAQSIVIHKDQNSYTLSINKANVFEGMNTLILVDANENQLAKRLFYINPKATEDSNFSLYNAKTEGSKQHFEATFLNQNGNFCAKIYPKNSKNTFEGENLTYEILINSYLNQKISNFDYYFSSQTKNKQYELDMAILAQDTDFDYWEKLKNYVPETKYEFDIGLTIKGTINSPLDKVENYKVKLHSFYTQVLSIAELNEKKEFEFTRILQPNEGVLSLSLLKMPNFEKKEFTHYWNITNNNRKYLKSFKGITTSCSRILEEVSLSTFEIPSFFGEIIPLDEVSLESKKPKLKYGKEIGNTNLTGIKIDESYKNISLLNFLESRGFIVERNVGDLHIHTRSNSGLNNGNPTPQIILNDRDLNNFFDELRFMRMDEIDEIYLNPYAIVPSSNNKQGIIKIYSKPNSFENGKNFLFKDLVIKKGFSPVENFENTKYLNYNQGYSNYAIIDWKPQLLSNEKSELIWNSSIPFGGDIIVEIFGTTYDGKIIHVKKEVNLN